MNEAMETKVDREPIAIRLTKLNQLLSDRSSLSLPHKSLLSYDGLLDSLFVLFDECSNEYLSRNQYVASFVKKYSSLISELKRLRVSIGDFNLKGIIGRGHFGEVQVVAEKLTGDVYAMKVLRKMDTLAQQNVSFYEEERDIMAKASSPWITQLHLAFQDRRHLYLVMDFHPGGDLLSLLTRYDDVFEESMAQFYIAEMVLAIHALHNMGYVHRDIKPENILIDRTGHIKLADFGSACQLKNMPSCLSNLPVGTPDYICPEVLIRMNNGDKSGSFGEECDWWSLGVCAYEMLFSVTPFTDHDGGSVVVTYANIMNHKKSLKFSKDREVSENAKHLLLNLLTDPVSRLNYDQIRVHPFFTSVDFDSIRQSRPPFIPTVTSSDDISNFEDFAKTKSVHFPDLVEKRTEFSGKDLPFVGFTFTKKIFSTEQEEQSGKENRHERSVVERRLTMKSDELHGARERCNHLEMQNQTLKIEAESLRKSLQRMEENLSAVVAERNKLGMEVPSLTAENIGLRRSVELERQKVISRETEISHLVTELSQASQKTSSLQEDDISRLNQQVDEYRELIEQLHEDRRIHVERISNLEKELIELAGMLKSSGDFRIEELRARVKIEFKDAYRSKLKLAMEKIKRKEEEFSRKERKFNLKLDEVKEQCFEMQRLYQAEKDDKAVVNKELVSLRSQFDSNNSRLSFTEDRCKSLESQVIKVRLLEERERELTSQLKDKGGQIVALATRIADQDEEIQKLRMEKLEIENQSFVVFEENEERLRKVHEQELVIALLKSNVDTLEQKVNSLKCDLLETKSPSSYRRTPRAAANKRGEGFTREAAPEERPETISTASSPFVFDRNNSISSSDLGKSDEHNDALFTFSYKIPSGQIFKSNGIADTSGSTDESNHTTSDSTDTQTLPTDDESATDSKDRDFKARSIITQTSFCSPAKRSVVMQTSFADHDLSFVEQKLQTDDGKCSTEVQTSFYEDRQHVSPSKRQASSSIQDFYESPPKKSNKDDATRGARSKSSLFGDENIDELVRVNSVRGINMTISTRLKCHKLHGKGKPGDQQTLPAADFCQSVSFNSNGNLYERDEDSFSCDDDDFSAFLENYRMKKEENLRLTEVIDELRRKISQLESSVLSARLMSPNEKVELQDKVSHLMNERAGLAQEVDRLRIRNSIINSNEKEVVTLRLSLSNYTNQVETLEQEKRQLAAKMSDFDRLKCEKKELKSRIDDLVRENDTLRKTSEELRGVLEKNLADYSQQCTDGEIKELRIKAAKLEVVELRSSNLEMQVTRIDALKSEKEELLVKMEKLREENTNLGRKVTNIEDLMAEKVELKEKIETLNLEISRLTEELARLKGHLEDLETNRIQDLDRKDIQMQEELREKSIKIEELKLVRKEFENKASSAEKLLLEKEKVERNLQEIKEENVSLKSKIDQLQSQTCENADRINSFPLLQTERDQLRNEVTRLEKELDEMKESVHEQRIRALDLKHELREKTAASENEISVLTFKLNKAEASTQDATESASKSREREAKMKLRLDEVQAELIQVQTELRSSLAELQSKTSDYESQIEKLTSEIKVMKSSLEDAQSQNEQILKERADATEKFKVSDSELKIQNSQLNALTSENNQLKLTSEKLRSDLTEKENNYERLDQQNDQLKNLCKELESQVEDLQMLEEHKDLELQELKERLKCNENLIESAKKTENSRIQKELSETRSQMDQHRMKAESLATQVIQLEHSVSVLELENRSVKCRLDGSTQGAQKLKSDIEGQMKGYIDEKSRLLQELEQLKKELSESKMHNEQLRCLCNELESQLKTFERICHDHEKRLSRDQSDQSVYKKAIGEQEREVKEIHQQLQRERDERRRVQERMESMKKTLDSCQTSNASECERLKAQLAQQFIQLNSFNEQLTASERKCSLVELDNKNLTRFLETRDQEMITLKEEISKELTRLQSLKTGNFQLSKDLEIANEKIDSLTAKKSDLENQIESLQAQYQQDRYKREETINQQSKLIGYLQDKVENTPRKKKLFAAKHGDTPGSSIQLREAQGTLEREREKCALHRSEIVHLREELHQTKAELARLKGMSDDVKTTESMQLSALDKRSQTLPQGRSVHSNQKSAPPSQKRPSERSSKDIPHKFITSMSNHPTRCLVCLGAIHFVQESAKCQDCGAVCHPRCLPDIPSTCGLPFEYLSYTAEMMRQARAVSTGSAQPSVANLHLQMANDMLISKAGKHSLERKWVVLRDNKLFLYNCKEDHTDKPLEVFDLCPFSGEVSVRSAVTAVELRNVVPGDLPYIMMLEFDPDSLDSARRLYLKAFSFKEKQRWVAAIEAIVSTNVNSTRIQDINVLGNTMLHLPKDRWLEINCTWPLNDEVILIGAASGLFAMILANSPENRLLVKIEGLTSVHAIQGRKSMDFLLVVSGRDRDLMIVDLVAVQRCIAHIRAGTKREPLVVQPKVIAMTSMCTVFDLTQTIDGLYLCTAVMDKIVLYKYNSTMKEFLVRKEVPTSRPCSCLHFGKRGVLFGTDRFYQLNMEKYTTTEFLDKSDPSLAFATLAAVQYDCFPVAVLAVNSNNEPEEFLLCFHEFGVFVDGNGRRSREQNVKWTGLPLAFAYRAPFLYTIHFNAVQLMEIMPSHLSSPIGLKTFVNLPGAQYLGPAIMSGAVYIATTSCEGNAEVVCIMGNEAMAPRRDVGKENIRSGRQATSMCRSTESGFVSTTEAPIRTRSSKRPTYIASSSTDRSSSTSNSSDGVVPGSRGSSSAKGVAGAVATTRPPLMPTAPGIDSLSSNYSSDV